MRNPNGFGSVYNLDGKGRKKTRRKPWVALAPAVCADGQYIKKTVGTFTTRIEALEALEQYRINPPPPKADMTVAEIWKEWSATNKYKNLSKSTQDGYSAAYKKLMPLKNSRIADVRTGEIQAIIDELERVGRSRSCMHDVKVLCGLLFTYAMQNDIVEKNYAQFIELPKDKETTKRALTDLELQKIKNGAAAGVPYADWMLILCYTGWRISELLSLTPFQYDRREQTLTGGMKTEAGKNRLVPIHPDIQSYVELWADKGAATIFCRPETNKDGDITAYVPCTANYFRKFIWPDLLKTLKLDDDILPHECRHTFITQLRKAGAEKVYIQRLVGHSSKDVTDKVYTHADIEDLRKTVNLLHFSAG